MKFSYLKFKEVFDGAMNITRTFPISRQVLSGRLVEDDSKSILVADWTSAEEKDVFEPGTYQEIVSSRDLANS
jgi:hypothetical protein